MSSIHARVLAPATALLTALLLGLAGLTAAPASAEGSLSVIMGWPPCTVGQPCSAEPGQTVQADGGMAPYTYEVTDGTFPPGLTLSPSGALSGVPSGGGTYTFTVTATDAVGDTASTSGSFGPYGVNEPNIELVPNHVDVSGIYVLPSAQKGQAYSQSFSATGGTPGYTYSIPARYGLPDGLTFSSDGVLSGTPTVSGQWDFGVQAVDSSTGTGPYAGLYMYELDIAPTPVSITTAAIDPAELGLWFYQRIEVSGGLAPYVFEVTSGTLPDGLTLSSGGVLSGTPTSPGVHPFTIGVTADTGGSASRAYSMTFAPTQPTLTPAGIPDATVGVPYAESFAGANGIAPYNYAVLTGTLPPGLWLTPQGLLSGTPRAAGTYTFFVGVRDSTTGPNFKVGGRTYTVHVAAAAPVATDSDHDGLSDADEHRLGTDPDRADSDRDGLDDGDEVRGIRIAQRVRGHHGPARAIGVVRPNPLRADTDDDGLGDGVEVHGSRIDQVIAVGRHHPRARLLGTRATDPTRADTDRDGLTDRVEISGSANRKHRYHSSDPTRWDTDRGGVGDAREIRKGADPADVKSGPRRPHRHFWALRAPR